MSEPLGVPPPPSTKVERIPTAAPMPYLRKGKPAEAFKKLKQMCIEGAGFDFLAICGDVMRERGFSSSKPGVAQKSRHKCGQAFDYNQADKHLIIVSEPKGGQQFFRTWLKCEKQDGSLGKKVIVKDIRGFSFNGYAWDFTEAAESVGLERIPAWSGWQSSYTKKEFWHYQLTEGTTYEEAIAYLYSSPSASPTPTTNILARGSKGAEVKEYQQKLLKLGYLVNVKDVDSDFGPRTELAVKAFQKAHGLTANGKIDPFTRNKIDQSIKEK